jgi:DNA (cytosine-5)-methyltransferase 1
MLTLGSLFSGIGGLELGFERTGGFVTRWQVENDPYATKVLEKHWPNVRRYGDITKLNADELERVDVIVGGFPCQPDSVAGKRKGRNDSRWLWPEYARLIRSLRPAYAVMENVPGLFSGGFGDVLRDLAEGGYDAEWQVLSAYSVGAPHIRERVFIVAYPGDGRQWELLQPPGQSRCAATPDARSNGETQSMAHAASIRQQGVFPFARSIGASSPQRGLREPQRSSWWAVEPDVGRVANGVPRRVDRLRCLGNAVVPQVAQYVAECILAHATEQATA